MPAIGASVSILIAYTVRTLLMGYVYYKVLKLDMLAFVKQTFLKLSPQLLVALLVGIACEIFNPVTNVYLRFGINGVVLVGVYFVLMWLTGFNAYEKQLLLVFLKKVRK